MSANNKISELIAKSDITTAYKRQSNEKKAIVFLMNKESHVNFLTEIIDFVKLEPSGWSFTKDKSIREMKKHKKISRIEFTEHLIAVKELLQENFKLVSKKEHEYLLSCMNNTQKKQYSKLFEE